MKVSERELRRLIREEKVRLRREDASKTRSISGQAGKKSRANRLRRLNEEETLRKTDHRPRPPFPGALEDQMMDMLEEYITRLVESGEVGVVEVETLLTQLVNRAIDIAVRDGVIQ